MDWARISRGTTWFALLALAACCSVTAAEPRANGGKTAPAPRALEPPEPLVDPLAVHGPAACGAAADSPCDGCLDSGPCCWDSLCDKIGWIGYVDWFQWRARPTGDTNAFLIRTDFNEEQEEVNTLTPIELRLPQNSGIRAGLGYRFPSLWEVSWNYTYFGTRGVTTIVPGEDEVLTDGLQDYEAISRMSSLHYSVHDIEFARWCYLSDSLSARVFGGFRWAMLDLGNVDLLEIDAEAFRAGDGVVDVDAYGLRFGAEARWRLAQSNLSLFGRAAGSVLAARASTSQTVRSSESATVEVLSGRTTRGVPVLETAAGFAWTPGPWELSIGYDMACWFDVVELTNITNVSTSTVPHDLLLDGLFVRLAFTR